MFTSFKDWEVILANYMDYWDNVEEVLDDKSLADFNNKATYFIAKYYPEEFDNIAFIKMTSTVFGYLEENPEELKGARYTAEPVHPQTISQAIGKDLFETMLVDAVLPGALRKANDERHFKWDDETNPFYEGMERREDIFKSKEFIYSREIMPEPEHPLFTNLFEEHPDSGTSIRKPIVDGKYNDPDLFAVDMFEKLNYMISALMYTKAKQDYNISLLDDLEILSKHALEGRYICDGELIEIEKMDILKDLPEGFVPGLKQTAIRKLIESTINERNVYCAYTNYVYKGTGLEWFLQLAILNAKWTIKSVFAETRKTWNEIKALPVKDLIKIFVETVNEYFEEVKIENITNKLKEIVKEKPILVNNEYQEPYLDEIPVFMGIDNFKIDSIDEYTRIGHPFEYDPEYRTGYDNYFRNWLFDFIDMFQYNESDKFADNNSYKILETKIEKDEYEKSKDYLFGILYPPVETVVETLLADFDFSKILEAEEICSLTAKVKLFTKGYLNKKSILQSFAYTMSLIKIILKSDKNLKNDKEYDEIYYDLNDEEINKFCFNRSTLRSADREYEKRIQTTDDIKFRKSLTEKFRIWLRPILNNIDTPEKYSDYIAIRREQLEDGEGGELDAIFDEFIEEELEILNEKIKEWNQYDPKKVKERIVNYLETFKPNIEKLYGDKWSEDIFDKIIENTTNFLSSGETMYENFVVPKIKLGDFGGVAIYYYKTLEYLVNQIFYVPFKINILDKVFNGDKESIRPYVNKSCEYMVQKRKLQPSLEYRKVTNLYIFNIKDKAGNNNKIEEFYNKRGVTPTKLKEFAKKMNKTANYRNDCAHPTRTTIKEAENARSFIYHKKEEAKELYELIFEIKEIFK